MKQIFLLACSVGAAGALEITAHRPPASSWQRTACGSPGGTSPTPGQPYTTGVDHGGNDMPPCGTAGCALDPTATNLDCETMCNATKGCAGYVFAPAACSDTGAPTCWPKSAPGSKRTATCRNSRFFPTAGTAGADIPSRWADEVGADRTPLVAYPRPQMVRGGGGGIAANRTALDELRDRGDASTWTNLNGLWEWEPASAGNAPQFGKALNGSILVPFPVEACLSGVAPVSSAAYQDKMFYRLVFDAADGSSSGSKTLLHFGAIDWQSSVYLNGALLGNHTGGYDGFSFEVALQPTGNELLVYAFDPSDQGDQPNGKQRISAISSPGGDTYTPSSGIWQTVWLEQVPAEFIESLKIDQASTSAVTVTARVPNFMSGTSVRYVVTDAAGRTVASAAGASNAGPVTIKIPAPQLLWSPTAPHLYDLTVTLSSGDAVTSYFGLRTFALGEGPKGKRPLLNGNFTFLAGFLDQSWWPDGQYTAPTDEALAYDVQVVPMYVGSLLARYSLVLSPRSTCSRLTLPTLCRSHFSTCWLVGWLSSIRYGMNMIRLHQKVNPERWYYHADRLGVVVLQDMVQKYGHASDATVPLFVDDFKAMVAGRGNHPCIVQFETFNEGDCWSVFKTKPFDVAGIVALSKQLDPTRLVDTDSGGGANNLHIGDVNDIHSYPQPGDPQPSATQYAMIGEFGGVGAFVAGKEWKPQACHTYLKVDTPHEEATTYIGMAAKIEAAVDHVSASVYTQTTDVELECDGFLNYDRSDKWSADDTAAIFKANQAIIMASAALN